MGLENNRASDLPQQPSATASKFNDDANKLRQQSKVGGEFSTRDLEQDTPPAQQQHSISETKQLLPQASPRTTDNTLTAPNSRQPAEIQPAKRDQSTASFSAINGADGVIENHDSSERVSASQAENPPSNEQRQPVDRGYSLKQGDNGQELTSNPQNALKVGGGIELNPTAVGIRISKDDTKAQTAQTFIDDLSYSHRQEALPRNSVSQNMEETSRPERSVQQSPSTENSNKVDVGTPSAFERDYVRTTFQSTDQANKISDQQHTGKQSNTQTNTVDSNFTKNTGRSGDGPPATNASSDKLTTTGDGLANRTRSASLDSSLRASSVGTPDKSQSLNETLRNPIDLGRNSAASSPTRAESAIQLPDTKQNSGRTDIGAQLPDTKQSSGRSDTGIGGGSNLNVRPETRNDANAAKLPDAKTLAGLDQKFGDKLNPSGTGGIPVLTPGLPDVFGGLKGDKDARGSKGELGGSRDGKDGSSGSRGDQATSKDGKSVDGKLVDGKNVDSKADSKALAGENPGKLGPDGRPLDGRQQGGSNLVHDGGTATVKTNHQVVDADGKLIGSRADATGQNISGGKNPLDVITAGNKGDKTNPVATPGVDGKGDKTFVLPPGSLPVPDLVNGIRNVGQNLDPRIGRPPSGGAPTEGVRTAITGAPNPGADSRNPLTGKGNVADGVKTIVTGGIGSESAKTDGKILTNQNGTKTTDIPIVPPPAVQLGEMVGNLRAIASRIFPQDSAINSFDSNNLPGRRTERMDTGSVQNQPQRIEPIIPFSRALGGDKDIRTAENFVIRLPQGSNQDRITVTRTESTAASTKDNVLNRSAETQISDNQTPFKAAEATHHPVKGDAQTSNQLDDQHEIFHDEAAEKLLVNLELVGTDDSTVAVEEEQIFPLAAVEYLGGEFEKAIADEDDDVAFDGDAANEAEDDQDTRYQYIVEAGDTVEMIAIKVFKNVTLAPLIYDINKDSIPIGMQDGRMSFILKIGTIIWLPFPKEIKAYMELSSLNEQS